MTSTGNWETVAGRASHNDLGVFLRLRPERKLLIATQVPTPPASDRRRLKREELHHRASLVVNLGGRQQRFPCLALDSSEKGFRVGWTFKLRRRQVVEVILDEDPFNAVQCSVIWVGRLGSKLEGEAGLESV